jgi:hypothetical protein
LERGVIVEHPLSWLQQSLAASAVFLIDGAAAYGDEPLP